ncbi:MAG: hypothetical protein Q8P90_03410 [bacterium]|nr:hypothetical protein [bacterium]
MNKKLKITLSLSIVAIVAIFLVFISLYWNDFAITPDASGLACGAKVLAETGEFSTYSLTGNSYEMCWRPSTYPVLQIIHAGLLKILPIQSHHLLLLTGGLAFLACVVGVWLIGWLLSKSPTIALFAGLFSALSPALIRSLVLTPQNLFGYMLIIFCIIFAILAITKQQHRWIAFALSPFSLLALVHDLSFGIAAIVFSSWFVLFYIKSWKIKIGLITTGIIVLVLDFTLAIFPVSIKGMIGYFINNSLPGFYHPIWDHPAIWGYLITMLAGVGLVFGLSKITKQIKWLLLIMLLVPIILGHLPLFGIGILPNRFIPFAWISLAIFASFGLVELRKYLKFTPIVFVLFAVLIVGAQATHAVVFMKDDIEGWSFRYRPHDGFAEALEWLDDTNHTGRLLGVQSATNQEILHAPLWYSGHTIYYPWYSLNHRDIQKFNVLNPSSPFSEIINQPENPTYQRLHAMYTIIAKPKNERNTSNIAELGISYFIISKDSPVYKSIWSTNKSEYYPVIYENTSYVIYDLKP